MLLLFYIILLKVKDMKRILMIMCLLMTVCLFGCNKEETEPKDDTGDVTDVTDGVDYAALASSMTFFLDPLKPAFGDMEKADELAIDTGSPDYDVKAGMSAFYNAGKKRFYVNYDTMDIDKFYYIIEIEKLDDGDTFLRLQQLTLHPPYLPQLLRLPCPFPPIGASRSRAVTEVMAGL